MIRDPSQPMLLTEEPAFAHAHRCLSCGLVWAHDPRRLCELFEAAPCPDIFEGFRVHGPAFSAVYAAAHQCPQCDAKQSACWGDATPRNVDLIWTGVHLRPARFEDFSPSRLPARLVTASTSLRIVPSNGMITALFVI